MDIKAKKYLESYLDSLPLEKRDKYQKFDSYYFCADELNANQCAELVLKGEKRATAGLLWSYEAEEEPLPEIGQLTVITNWDKEPQCIIEIESVEIKKFEEVDAAFAFEEGEGDKSLEFWKREHWKFFSMECKEIGKEPHQSMQVVLERFKVVHKINK